MKKRPLKFFHSRDEVVSFVFAAAIKGVNAEAGTVAANDFKKLADMISILDDIRLVQHAFAHPGTIRVEGRASEADEIIAKAEAAQKKAFRDKLVMLLNQGLKNTPGYLTTMDEDAILKDLLTWRPEYKKEESWKVLNVIYDWRAQKRRNRKCTLPF